MRKIFKLRTVIGLLILLFLIAIPLVINRLYMYGYRNRITPNTIFEASDLLFYVGAVISALSTGFLCYISYRLNRQVLALSVADIERNKYSTVMLESVTISDNPWTVPVQGYNNAEDQLQVMGFTKISNIGFHIFNIGPAPLSKVVVHYLKPRNVDIAAVEFFCSLAPNFRINSQIPMINGQDVCLSFEFISCYNKVSLATCKITPAGIGITKFDTIVDFQIQQLKDASNGYLSDYALFK